MNYRMIFHTLGWILVFEGAFLLLPGVTALAYGEVKALWAFLISTLICLLTGLLLAMRKPRDQALRARDGFVIVSLSWVLLSLFGSIPFMLSGATDSFIDALFETVSGFTTAGSSIFESVEALPHAILLWRSFTHWVGGMGILVFVLAFLPLSGGQNMHIMRAESPGPSVSKLVPRIRTTALWLYSIYFAMTLLQAILLLCGGMSFFDAINTAFATAGTGGFGVKNDSMASYSPYIQTVVTVFMLLFSLNFGSYFLALRGRFKEFFTSEIKIFLLIVFSAVTIITLNVRHLFGSVGEAIRHVLFTVSSLISTTGFATVDFDLWPNLSRTVLVLLIFIGACAGSTGGGMKVSRILLFGKSMRRELHAASHPKQVRRITVDGHAVGEEVIRSLYGYLLCFVAVFVSSMLLISLDTGDLVTNFTAVATAIGNVGPGLAKVGPTMNFGFFSPLSKIVLMFDMLAGRLEFYPMLLLFAPSTWRK